MRDARNGRKTSVGRKAVAPTGPAGGSIGEGLGSRDGTATVVFDERPNLAQTRNLGPTGVASASARDLKIARHEDRKISRP